MKKLADSTQEEIGRLYPVEMSPCDVQWPALFGAEQQQRIAAALGPVSVRIEHFGSTAVPGLPAKDTLDLLVELPVGADQPTGCIERMQNIGYEFMWRKDGNPPYFIFVKGYDPVHPKARIYHVHVAPQEHTLWDRLYFRNYLRQYPAVAREYANSNRP